MSQDKNRNPRNLDNKGGSSGFNFLLYTLIFGVILLGVLTYLSHLSTDELSYDDLIRLAENSEYDSRGGKPLGSNEAIEVTRQDKTIQYRNVREVKFGIRSITGRVDRKSSTQTIRAGGRAVDFRTNKIHNDEIENQLIANLKKNNISW